MENLPAPAAPIAAPKELNDLQARYDQLQQLVSSLLLILIVISGTLSVFLRHQWHSAQAELNAMQTAAAPLLAEYAKNHASVQDFVRKLAEYGRTHPDFAPIVTRYGLESYLGNPIGGGALTNSLPAPLSGNK